VWRIISKFFNILGEKRLMRKLHESFIKPRAGMMVGYPALGVRADTNSVERTHKPVCQEIRADLRKRKLLNKRGRTKVHNLCNILFDVSVSRISKAAGICPTALLDKPHLEPHEEDAAQKFANEPEEYLSQINREGNVWIFKQKSVKDECSDLELVKRDDADTLARLWTDGPMRVP
jgi:hypothetical protein